MQTYDAIVLGVGGFGSGALYHLAKRGLRVLGIEQYDVGHDRGSSHGETRIIRQAYFEHPDYVPLCRLAYEQWRTLEVEAVRPLLHRTGLMLCGPDGGEAVPGAKLAAERYGVAVESLDIADAKQRFRGFTFPEGTSVVYEPDAGYLEVEECVRAHVEVARRHGAEVRTGETVVGWTLGDEQTVQVSTDRGEYEAAALVVTAGPWAEDWLGELRLGLRVLRKVAFWHPVRSAVYDEQADAPGFLFELDGGSGGGVFYGFPCLDGRTLKVSEHTGGQEISDPTQAERAFGADDLRPIAGFLRACLPDVDPQPVRHSVCFYTMSPDTHFLVDRHPLHERVVFGAGFSGHGFKFTGVIGQALADLAIDGRTALPVEFLRIARLGAGT